MAFTEFNPSPNSYRVHKRSNGQSIWWKDMTDEHLEGAIRKLRRQAEATEERLLQKYDSRSVEEWVNGCQKPRILASEMEVYLKSRKRERENFQAPKLEYFDYGRTLAPKKQIIPISASSDWHWYTSREAQTTVGFQYFGTRTWRSGGGITKMWKDMDATHIMNCVRLLERAAVNNPIYSKLARDMHRYCAHREKAHA